MTIDITLTPEVAANQGTVLPASILRFYESEASPGNLSIVAVDTGDFGGSLVAGLRLTPTQVIELHDVLSEYLDKHSVLSVTSAFEQGNDSGYEAGHSDGWDSGYSEGQYETEQDRDYAYQDGYDTGYSDGYDEGLAEGRAEAEDAA